MSENPFLWQCQPKAEAIILSLLDRASSENSFIGDLQKDLLIHTSTRLFDWLDYIVTPSDKGLEECGFITLKVSEGYRIYYHPGAQLPKVVVQEKAKLGIAVKVESIADFLLVRGISGEIEGAPLSGFRRCLVSHEHNISFWVVERRGMQGVEPTHPSGNDLEEYFAAKEKWESRPRVLSDEEEAMKQTIAVGEEIVDIVGEDLAAWIVLEAERKYWQARNRAGQVQKNRQDSLGMGWANHDHHTFRSSRKHFSQLVRFFEMLGFHCRERFYAGKEAGWGAQVMENPRAGLVLFLDVDLSPDELQIDFAHHRLKELDHLGTIGLWCALHGDSILKAGMHHLEAQFMHDELTDHLAKMGVAMMDPFSNFTYLKQAFTMGEVWRVDPYRVNKLQTEGKISKEQAEKFLAYGAVGSHLENLQRREGYKGFNQKNVSVIIKKTDPRAFL